MGLLSRAADLLRKSRGHVLQPHFNLVTTAGRVVSSAQHTSAQLRRSFPARPGSVMVAADYGQQEVRVLAKGEHSPTALSLSSGSL